MLCESITPATRTKQMDESESITIIRGTNRQNITQEDIVLELDYTPHGGGDYRMFDQLMGAGGDDPYGRCAGFQAGAYSALVGICANESILSGMFVQIPHEIVING
jgi:hypothetical protein